MLLLISCRFKSNVKGGRDSLTQVAGSIRFYKIIQVILASIRGQMHD